MADAQVDQFQLTIEHIALLRHANVDRDCSGPECGYVGLGCKRPFGNSDLEADVVKILGWPTVETDDGIAYPKGTRERVAAIWSELGTALEVILASGKFQPGLYVTPRHGRAWSFDHE